MQFRRTSALIIVVLLALIAGTLATVKLTTDHLLYQAATSDAQHWARYVAENVKDLEQIAGGEQPSSRSMTFFEGAQRVGLVFRYEIFNREGYSQLVSDRQGTALVDLSEFNPAAASAVKTNRPVVAVKESTQPDRPSFFAEAYVPVLDGRRPIAVVAAYVDQTAERARYFRSFLIAAVALCSLTALAFAIPAAAWYRRTKEKERSDAEIHFLAKHDGMTRLANRGHLNERLDEALTKVAAIGSRLAVHYIDLDHFKEVNDTLGHQAGDTLIKLAAERLRASTRVRDIVARVGGDEFVVIQADILDDAEAAGLAERLLHTMAKPFVVNGHDVATAASIGVALAPQDGIEAERLLKSADLALYKSKSDGRGCFRFFTPEMDAELQARLKLERTIRDAVQNESFALNFQPLVDMPSGRLTGFEALLRLREADGNDIPPTTIVPMAEDMGLIGKIGTWVIRKACFAAAQWPHHLTVAVNLSPAQFYAGSVCDVVSAALAESGLAPRQLELEITEALLLRDTDAILAELGRLKALGVAVVMDDFGTGYSSLSYLWRFPFDKIKIDRAFMQTTNAADAGVQTIIKTIVGLGHSLHMRVTVEGIEDDRQAEFVRSAACDEVQGFYFGRPLAEADLPARILAEAERDAARSDRAAQDRLRVIK
jgi:diguanylate cyclase (GGDEF)-like protein